MARALLRIGFGRLEGLAEVGGIVLSAATHEHVRKILPLAYTDLGPRNVKNVEEPVRAFAIGVASDAWAASRGKPQPLLDKPTIAVLPFQNMSGDLEREYFSDGITEDIITNLSRFRELRVIARNSTFGYKGVAVEIARIGQDLKADYLVQGSVRSFGGQVRITAQLIRIETGMHIWAERYDRELTDVFSVQDEITARITRRQLAQPMVPPVHSLSSCSGHTTQRRSSFLEPRSRGPCRDRRLRMDREATIEPSSPPASTEDEMHQPD